MPKRSGQSMRAWSPELDRTVKRASVEQVGLLADDLVVERLEAEPAGEVVADLAGGDLRLLLVDQHRRPGRLGQQLRLARALHRDEPPGGLVDRVADREEPVVAQ